jgi:hypothetical protein
MVRRRQPPMKPGADGLPGVPKAYNVDGKPMVGREVVSAQHPYTPVYCQVRGNSDLVPIIVLQLDDALFKDSKGEIPVHVVGHCPRCGDNFQVRGELHEITVDYIDPPQPVVVPDIDLETGEIGEQTRMQTVNVSIAGVRTCPGDDSGGKGICGFRFRLVDNVLIAE